MDDITQQTSVCFFLCLFNISTNISTNDLLDARFVDYTQQQVNLNSI